MDAIRKDSMPSGEIYTIKDIYALPEGERAELINGQIYYMSSPSRRHQRLSGKPYQAIANYIDNF